ncbi:DinB family protein [Mucilaginibacter sp. SP1R1]|uniref:DinB family protein n=1 Tax=Mucilaginibacter sp. SP1R1 TaxID=2723091 RepID=UPI00161783BD|nr:DinB family protein [Mucilaginibacter sp. SP1R1]MBB6147945.1 putative damage-inducible protein DinB [Mucilaginibacter sp. SP1R1]
MSMIPMLLKEMEQEAQTTRKMLERIPNDKYQWQPHEKSMTIQRLATHIAELPGWVAMALTTNELDFASNPYKVSPIDNNTDLLSFFEESLESGKTHLEQAKDEDLEKNWTLRNGDHILSVSTKAEVIRMSYSQTVHHRAQLGVYLRLLNIPIPGSYGPSADEGSL